MSPHDASPLPKSWDALAPSIELLGSAAARLPPAASALALPPASSSPAPPRRIALISDDGAPLGAFDGASDDGQSISLMHLACELGRAGVAVDIFTRCATPSGPPVVDLQAGVRVIQVPVGRARHAPRTALAPQVDATTNFLNRFMARFIARFITRFARRQPAMYDLVHANGHWSGMIAAHLERTLGLPFILASHRPAKSDRPATGAVDMQYPGGVEPARIVALPCGFSPAAFWPVPMREARDRLRIAAHRFVVLHAGRMAPHKGIDTLIQGIARLRQRHDVDAELIVVGGERASATGQCGLEQARLHQLAVELGISAHIRFEGARPHPALRDYYAAADVLASAPWCGSPGLAPVEAMACARVVVATEVGASKGVVLDGVTGHLVPPRDPEALAERLASLQRQPERARRMGQLGRVRVCEHHTWQRVAQQLNQVYSLLLEQARASQPSPFYFSQESA